MPTPFTVTIDPHGRVTFDLGPAPSPELRQRARELAASLDGGYLAESSCLSAEQREALAQRLARLLLGGAS